MKLIPAKSEKEAADLAKQLEQLHADKLKQEEQLKEVMESFKTETEVRYFCSCVMTGIKYSVLSLTNSSIILAFETVGCLLSFVSFLFYL